MIGTARRSTAYAPSMSATGERGIGRWFRLFTGIIASLGGLIVLPVATTLMVFGLVVPFGLRACKIEPESQPEDLGVTVDDEGAIVALVPSCFDGRTGALQVVGPDQAVLWRVEAEEPLPVRTFVIGVAPEGFQEVVALPAGLDPAAIYDVQLLPDAESGSTSSSTTTTTAPPEGGTTTTSDEPLFEQVGGAHTEFRPADLVAGEIYFASQRVAPDEFASAACGD